MERWKEMILEFMSSYPRKYVKTLDIENYMKSKLKMTYDDNGGYYSFASILDSLVSDSLIAPVKAQGHNHQSPPVFNQYKMVKNNRTASPVHLKNIMTNYPLLNMSEFMDESEFNCWKSHIDAIYGFLASDGNTKKVILKANERSFELFHDEKFLLSKDGSILLSKLGIGLRDLNCVKSHEPFVEYRNPRVTKIKNILIIENKDTFDSVKELMKNGVSSWFGVSFDMVIYGEGDKIQRSYSFLKEYELQDYHVYYFGDLDARGIWICTEVMKQDDKVKPFVPFYMEMLRRHGQNPCIRKIDKPLKRETIKESFHLFSSYFSAHVHELLRECTKIVNRMQTYIPQEALNLAILSELSEGVK